MIVSIYDFLRCGMCIRCTVCGAEDFITDSFRIKANNPKIEFNHECKPLLAEALHEKYREIK